MKIEKLLSKEIFEFRYEKYKKLDIGYKSGYISLTCDEVNFALKNQNEPPYFFYFSFARHVPYKGGASSYLSPTNHGCLIMYKKELFLVKMEPYHAHNLNDKENPPEVVRETQELIIQCILHDSYKKEKKFEQIKKDVKSFEKISEIESKLKREDSSRLPIPEDVKMYVWRRDEGKCVLCFSQKNLEFDHIIPYSKGGSQTARNLQLLCQTCNRKKSDKI